MTKKEHIVSYSLDELKKMKGKSNWKKVDSMRDEDIDYSDIPELGEDFWRNLQLTLPHKKKATGIRLDEDVTRWFKASVGKGYQSHINAILRAYMFTHRDKR